MELKIRALLALGEKPKDIAERLDCKYDKVLIEKRKMKKESEDTKIKDVTALDPVALEILVDKARGTAPAKVVEKLEAVHEGILGLQLLDGKFHETFTKLLNKADEFIDSDKLKPSEWVAITNSLSNAYNNIYNNSGVNVHVDNSTQVSNNSLSMFKGAMRV